MLDMATNTDNLTIGDVISKWFGWISVIALVYVVLSLIAAVLVARKAGYSHWLGVIAVLVPVVGPVVILLFAFLKWPALRERDAAKALLKKNNLALPPAKPNRDADAAAEAPDAK